MRQLKFRKVVISRERYESACIFDVNNDGFPDIVSGAYWYEGPDFSRRRRIGHVQSEGEYFDDFFTIPLDVNGDGYLDFLTGGWFGRTLKWKENPASADREWKEHAIAECGSIETAIAADIDGDGEIEILPNTPGRGLTAYKLATDSGGRGTGEFRSYNIYEGKQGHGLGAGDITGNGRPDIILSHGWLESPENPLHGDWAFHPDFDFGRAGIPIVAADVNGNGLTDLIVGQAHDYGLDWWEQLRGPGGGVSWKKHEIDPCNSQYHCLKWADIDGDGDCELITGKRYRAHCGKDPGAEDNAGIYYFKYDGGSFRRHVIDCGPAGKGKGCGIYFDAADLLGRGRLDVLAPGKDGLCLYYNEGY